VGNQNPLRIKIRRDINFHNCKRDPINGLEGGEKVESFEYLENNLSQKRSKSQERGKHSSLDHNTEDPSLRNKGKV
jgi:hypothetical protein